MKQILKHSCVVAAVATLVFALPLQATASDAKAKGKAKPAAAAALPDLSPEQLANADRVLMGKIDCEFNQSVDVSESPAKKGYFIVEFKGVKYDLAPEATTTGAVRLENKKTGAIWLQIGNKSMLMKSGHRLVDNCVHPSQKS